jgi:hypothetical protein
MRQIFFRLSAIGLVALVVSKLRAPFLRTAIDYGSTFVAGHVIEATALILLAVGLWRGAVWWTWAYVALAAVTTLDGTAMLLMAASEPQMMGGLGKILVGLALLLGGFAARIAIRVRQRQATV